MVDIVGDEGQIMDDCRSCNKYVVVSDGLPLAPQDSVNTGCFLGDFLRQRQDLVEFCELLKLR